MMRALLTSCLRRFAPIIVLLAPALASASQSACVTIQGNGPRFMSLIGEAVALLESDILPVVAEGGSSAALVAPALRATLQNASVLETNVFDDDGKPLSVSQKAALVLAASSGPGDTVLFLPSLQRFGATLRDLATYLASIGLAQAFLSSPTQHIGTLETVAGQGNLIIDFLAHADFRKVLAGRTVAERNRTMMETWVRFGDLMFVTPRDFIRALVTSPRSGTARSEEIKRRYFSLFRTENVKPGETPEQALARYNRSLERLERQLQGIPDDRLLDAYMRTLDLFRRVPYVGYVAAAAMRPFHLPSPERVWNAYKSRSVDGSMLALPMGTLLHTTARAAETGRARGTLRERHGLENFFQVYLPSSDISHSLSALHRETDALGQGFIEFPTDDRGWASLLPPSQTLVLKPRPLAEAVAASIAEPGAFVRTPIRLAADEQPLSAPAWRTGTSLVTFGGWLTPVDTTLLRQLPQCRSVDFFVDVSNLRQGLWFFQEGAIRAVLEGGAGALWDALTGWMRRDEPDPAKAWMARLWRSFRYSQSIPGRLGHISLDFDWENPSRLTGADGKRMNLLFDLEPSAHFLRAYQDAAMRLSGSPHVTGRAGLLMLRPHLTRIDVGSARSEAELRHAVEALIGPRP